MYDRYFSSVLILGMKKLIKLEENNTKMNKWQKNKKKEIFLKGKCFDFIFMTKMKATRPLSGN